MAKYFKGTKPTPIENFKIHSDIPGFIWIIIPCEKSKSHRYLLNEFWRILAHFTRTPYLSMA